MIPVWVLYRVEPRQSGYFPFVAWLWLIAEDGAPCLAGSHRSCRTLAGLRRKMPEGFGADPRFAAGKWDAPSVEGDSMLMAIEGWMKPPRVKR